VHSYFFFVPNTDDDSRTHLGKLKVSLELMGLSLLVLKTTYNNISVFITLVSFIVKYFFTDDRSIFFFLNTLASTYRPHRPIQG